MTEFHVTKKLLMMTLFALAVTLFVLTVAPPAHAQATRTWVSGVGDDVNPCSRTAPCKTFAGAISKTAAGGEIDCIDPGGFGAVTITKAITIDCNGTFGSILAAGTNGIIVNAGVNDVIRIKHISINGIGTGLNGIRFLAGKTLHVEGLEIMGFTQDGIEVNKTAAGNLRVTDTTIMECVSDGISITSTVGNVLVELDRVRLWGNGNGLRAGNGSRAILRDSDVSQSALDGVLVEGTASQVDISNTALTLNNGSALHTNTAGANARLNNVDFWNNSTGINITAGAVCSPTPANNHFGGNTVNGPPNNLAACAIVTQ